MDWDVYEKLPKGSNKSAIIEMIVKQHYQAAGADVLYRRMRDAFLTDIKLDDKIYNKVSEILSNRGGYE